MFAQLSGHEPAPSAAHQRSTLPRVKPGHTVTGLELRAYGGSPDMIVRIWLDRTSIGPPG